MRCGAGPLAVVAALFWTHFVLLSVVDARKERKRQKEATPQHTETFNSTLSNSEELGGGVKVGIISPSATLSMLSFLYLYIFTLLLSYGTQWQKQELSDICRFLISLDSFAGQQEPSEVIQTEKQTGQVLPPAPSTTALHLLDLPLGSSLSQ